MTGLRVVVLSQWYPPEKAFIPADVAEGLADAGHEVTVLTGFPNYPAGKVYDGWRQRPWLDSRVDGHSIRRVALYPSHDTSPVRRAAGYISFGMTSTAFGWSRLRSADAVYVYHPPLTAAFGPWLSRVLRGAPYVLHVQDLWPDSVVASGMVKTRSARAVEGLVGAACRAAYRRAAGVICIAPTMAAILRDRGVPERALHVIPNWADESRYFPADRQESVARDIGLADCFSVMFAGNIGDMQGLDVAIRAAAEVRDLADFRLVIVGDGVARIRLQRLADDLKASNVRFIGPQPPAVMNGITSAADIQLVCLRDLPFLRGTVPSKLGAILASGLPIICTVAGDANSMIEFAGAGWTCSPGNVQALAQVFRQAHAAPKGDLDERGRAGRKYYEDHLARQTGTHQIEAILSSASGRRR